LRLETRRTATIVARAADTRFEFPTSLFPDHTAPAIALSFRELARRLTGKIERVDSVGLVAPPETNPGAWTEIVNNLSKNFEMYEYPRDIGEYDPDKERLVYVFSASDNQLPTKFALMWGVGNVGPVLQIDTRTNLTREQIKEHFPESFELPGLGDFFRTVDLKSSFRGIERVRMHLRYAQKIPGDWDTGEFFRRGGTLVVPGGPAAQLPQPNCG
jgi:hypothetical protein